MMIDTKVFENVKVLLDKSLTEAVTEARKGSESTVALKIVLAPIEDDGAQKVFSVSDASASVVSKQSVFKGKAIADKFISFTGEDGVIDIRPEEDEQISLDDVELEAQ